MPSPSLPRFVLHPSPIGDILIVTISSAVVAMHPVDDDASADLSSLSHRLGASPVAEETDAARMAVRQVDEYFAGMRRVFELPLDPALVGGGFTGAALEAIARIPFGETASYGEVAVMAGHPGAARAVGTACARTPFSLVVPVHRVVRADGSLGPYGGRPEIKRFLVEHERRVAAGAAE